jgi:hypothetical protein
MPLNRDRAVVKDWLSVIVDFLSVTDIASTILTVVAKLVLLAFRSWALHLQHTVALYTMLQEWRWFIGVWIYSARISFDTNKIERERAAKVVAYCPVFLVRESISNDDLTIHGGP